eukprot:14166_1
MRLRGKERVLFATLLFISFADAVPSSCGNITDCFQRLTCDVGCPDIENGLFNTQEILGFPPVSIPGSGNMLTTTSSLSAITVNRSAPVVLRMDIDRPLPCNVVCVSVATSITFEFEVRLSGVYIQEPTECRGGFIRVFLGPVLTDSRSRFDISVGTDKCKYVMTSDDLSTGSAVYILMNLDDDRIPQVPRQLNASVTVQCVDVAAVSQPDDPAQTSGSSSSNVTIPVGLLVALFAVVLSLLIAVLALAFVMFQRRKSSTEVHTAWTSPTPRQEYPPVVVPITNDWGVAPLRKRSMSSPEIRDSVSSQQDVYVLRGSNALSENIGIRGQPGRSY